MSNFWGTRAKSREKILVGNKNNTNIFTDVPLMIIPCRQLCQYWNRLKLIFRNLNPLYKICSLLVSLTYTLFIPLCFISILIIFTPAHYFMYYNSWYSYMFRLTISHIHTITYLKIIYNIYKRVCQSKPGFSSSCYIRSVIFLVQWVSAVVFLYGNFIIKTC